MKEFFLIYLWEQRLLKPPLFTTDGKPVEVIYQGIRNHDAGPDFVQARVRIGETLWAGSVEVHVNAGDWYKHHHESDPAYDNVVLHVVYHHDREVYDKSRQVLATLEVKGCFDEQLLLNYQRFVHSRAWLPCARMASKIQRFTWLSWLDRMATERFEEKNEALMEVVASTKYDWDEAFWRLLLAGMGFKVNGAAFEMLGQMLPFQLMLKHADQPLQLEALLLGVAGLLEVDPEEDEYLKKLQKEFTFLQKKYHLRTMPSGMWKFMRMRPANFPTLRLAQLAMLVHRHGRLFAKVMLLESSEFESFFNITAGEYWHSHYRLGEPSSFKQKNLGSQAIHLILINTVARMLFAWGTAHNNEKSKDKALMLLELLPAENNNITRRFSEAGISASSALHSQALLHLHRNYCAPRRCLECRIGHLIIRGDSFEVEQ